MWRDLNTFWNDCGLKIKHIQTLSHVSMSCPLPSIYKEGRRAMKKTRKTLKYFKYIIILNNIWTENTRQAVLDSCSGLSTCRIHFTPAQSLNSDWAETCKHRTSLQHRMRRNQSKQENPLMTTRQKGSTWSTHTSLCEWPLNRELIRFCVGHSPAQGSGCFTQTGLTLF